jgi:hypothetical protein
VFGNAIDGWPVTLCAGFGEALAECGVVVEGVGADQFGETAKADVVGTAP